MLLNLYSYQMYVYMVQDISLLTKYTLYDDSVYELWMQRCPHSKLINSLIVYANLY